MIKTLFRICLLSAVLLPLTGQGADAETAKRQCRSVHLRHGEFPKDSKALYVEAKALESAPGTYFCAANFNDGYIGFQELGNGHKWLIFSVWDPVSKGDNPHDIPENERAKLIQKGDNVTAKRFGGEGTGGQSFMDYEWKVDEPMRFLVIRKPDGDTFKQVSGYFFNNKTKAWELISCWRTEQKPGEFSYAVSFVEDFARNYTSAKQIRKAAYGPAFACSNDGKWTELRTGTFTADDTPSDAIRAEIIEETGAFSIQTGGNTTTTDFTLNMTKALPDSVKLEAPPKSAMPLIEAPLLKEQAQPEPEKKADDKPHTKQETKKGSSDVKKVAS